MDTGQERASDEDDWFDPDIRAMKLDYAQKAGLQIYRNYTHSFEAHAIKRLIEVLNRESLDLHDFENMANRIVSEDGRYLPVIICAYADDLLKGVFKSSLPDGIPGGKASMISGYGALADLAKRIQLAYAFDVLSRDLMSELDKVRSVRNKLAHSWDVDDLSQFFGAGKLADIHPVEELLAERRELAGIIGPFEPLTAFRIRMVWIVGRLVYEAAAYHRAKSAKVDPHKALYGKSAPMWLREVSRIALDATLKIIADAEAGRTSSTSH